MNKLIALAVVLLIVIFLFVYVSSQKSLTLFSISSNANTTPKPTPNVQNANEKNTLVQLTIQNKKIIDGPTALQVTQGAMVILRISSDADGMLDFPGYDQHVQLVKNVTVTLSFLASKIGHFEYRLVNTKPVLGAIDVYPQ
jgi:hypothetical protein